LVDAATECWLRSGDVPKLALESVSKFLQIVRSSVGQLPFQQCPDGFIGVQLWSVAGEVLHVQPRVAATQLAKGSSFVDAAVVQQCDNVPSEVAQNFHQERYHFFLGDIVPEEHPKQSQSSSGGAHRYA